MFLSFDPLVSLLNSLQVLKMQLHQSINLERQRNRGRQGESEGGGIPESKEEIGETRRKIGECKSEMMGVQGTNMGEKNDVSPSY